VLIGHVAQATKTIRVGSGGIMLPNHASLHVAEVFRTLEALHPNRIDLGIGRAPGSGRKASEALRSERGLMADNFPTQMKQLRAWMKDQQVDEFPQVVAVPDGVPTPKVWMLGSSDFGAQYAAHEGLPYAFAQHFSQMPALPIMRMYHQSFRPSPDLARPYGMMAIHVICAETDEAARDLALSSDLSFSIFVGSGKSIPLPTVTEAKAYPYTAEDWQAVRKTAMPKFVGSPASLKKMLAPFIDSGLVQELMVLSMIHDQTARQNSYQLLKDALEK